MQLYRDTASVVGAAAGVLSGADPTVAIGTLAGIGVRRAMTSMGRAARAAKRRAVSAGVVPVSMDLEEGVGQSRPSGGDRGAQGPFTAIAYAKHSYGIFKTLPSVKRFITNVDTCSYVTHYFGNLTGNALEPNSGALKYHLRNQEGVSLSIGRVGETLTVPDATEFPFHIYSLCNRNDSGNIRASNGNPTDNVVGHYAYSDQGTLNGPVLKFAPLVGQREFGAQTPAQGQLATCNDWSSWSATQDNSMVHLCDQRMRHSVLRDVEVNMLLQAAYQNPTTFYISLIRIHDDKYGPDAPASQDRDNVYLPMIRKLLGNPIHGAPLTRKTDNTISVLKTWEYFMNPTVTIDSDATPPQRNLKLHINLNHLIKWNYLPQHEVLKKDIVDDANYVTASYQSVPSEYMHQPPDYRDRYFLVVRANSKRTTLIDNSIPTYDLRLKATHVFEPIDI